MVAMVSPWSLGLTVLSAWISMVTSLNIPLEVEQLPTITKHTSGPVTALPMEDSLTMTCEARGNPPPEYRWTKDGEHFTPPSSESGSGTFVLRRPHAAFQGKYRCYASNRLGTAMTEEIEVIVTGVPKFPKENIEPIVVDEGQPVILRCNPPDGFPPHKIYWMSIGLEHIQQDERVSMGNDGNLYFSNALQNDSRRDYCCFAAFTEIGTIIQKTAMAVLVRTLKPDSEVQDGGNSTQGPPARMPSLMLPPGVQTLSVVMKGAQLELECIAEGFPTPEMEWIKMAEKLLSRANILNHGKRLTISNVEEGDNGKYMCKAKNSEGEAVHYFDVVVEEPPKWITGPPQSQLAVIGSDVHIKCLVGGKPPPEIVWRRNGEILTDDPSSNMRVLKDTVVLHNSVPENSAVYQCEAFNKHGRLLANAGIMVMNMAPLMLTRDHQEYAVVEGREVFMNCSVFSSPPPSISWDRVETPQTVEGERSSVHQNGSLQITGARKEDSGEYVCNANNTEGKGTVNAILGVKDPTRIASPPRDLQAVSGSTAQFECRAEHDATLAASFELLWSKDGQQIPVATMEHSRYSIEVGVLRIMSVNQSDEGVYTCIAKNILDRDTASAVLTVLDVPDAPGSLQMSELQNRSVRLSWVPGSDHNSSIIEFIVEYQEDQWQPGNWKELQKVPGNQATAVLELHGHLSYQFRVFATNAVGPGPPSEPTEMYKTPPAAPDRNPDNIKIQGHLHNQMDISWKPLLPVEHNGPGLQYKISYRRAGVEDVWTEHLVKRHSFVVKDTPTFVPYEVKIQSRNAHGWGPEPRVVTGYSGEDVPTAAPRDVAVEVINATLLRVSWTRVPPAIVRGHLGGYNVHWLRERSLSLNSVGGSPGQRHSLSFPGNRSGVLLPGLKPFSEYTLTVSVFNRLGSGPSSDPVSLHMPEGVPNQVPILTASNAQTSSMSLVWGPPLEANGILTGYMLQYQLVNETTREVADSQEVNITGADATQWLLRELEPGSTYRLSLRACTRAGCGPPLAQEASTMPQALPAVFNISSCVSDTFAKISWTASEEQRRSQLYVAYMANRLSGQQSSVPTQAWFVGTMCALALLTLITLVACFVCRNKGGKYAGTPQPAAPLLSRQPPDMAAAPQVKEKEVFPPDLESQSMNDDTFCEYSDSECDGKPLTHGSLCSPRREDPCGDRGDPCGDSISRDSLVDYADGGGEFSEDGSFIGEYSEQKHRGSVGEAVTVS